MTGVLSQLAALARLIVRLGGGIIVLGRALFVGVLLLLQLVRSYRRLSGGLRCPRGHRVETEGTTFSCSLCGFTYEGGSQWLCPNPECGATTPYVACPTCGLSVSSPYRFLHR